MFALRCSAILAFSAARAAPVPPPTDFEKAEVLVCEEVIDALGLCGSFSSPVFSRFSRVSNILFIKLARMPFLRAIESVRFRLLGPDQCKCPVRASVSLSDLGIGICETLLDDFLDRV